jgi:hypothetical protein
MIDDCAVPGEGGGLPGVTTADDATPELAFRRSLRFSQQRREGARRRRRRKLVGRRGVALALSGLAVASAGAMAQSTVHGSSPAAARGASVAAVQRALGLPADGVYGPATRRAVRAFQRRHGLTPDGVAGPRTLAALGLRSVSAHAAGNGGVSADDGTTTTAGTTTTTAPPAGTSAVLAAIAKCESGGNPTAVSRSGRYRGKYQFSRATWAALGGTGDPAKAPEAVQDQLAATLYAQRGPSAWPACSRRLHLKRS